MGSPMIRLSKVGVTFQPINRTPVVALEEVNLAVDAGEFVCVVGASGSGKSTMLRLVDGLLFPTTGTVSVGDSVVDGPGPDRGMVFQRDGLLPWVNNETNVSYGLRLQGVRKAEALARARDILERVGLADFAAMYPHELSGGMRQRINLARALATDPSILLLDEPFAALDAQTREIMSTELLRIWDADKKTVMFVTHQIEEAVYLADRVVVMSARPGRVSEIVHVDFPRPRPASIRRTIEFNELVQQIWLLIESEVRASLEIPTGR